MIMGEMYFNDTVVSKSKEHQFYHFVINIIIDIVRKKTQKT